MRTVWKYPVQSTACHIDMPANAKIIHLESQAEERIVLWVEVDTDSPLQTRGFLVVGTGRTVPYGYEHVGSVQDGLFMWHLYENQEYQDEDPTALMLEDTHEQDL